MILVSGIATLARPTWEICVHHSPIFHFSADVKKAESLNSGFYNLEPGNVVVPTAVESHSANATHSLASGDIFMILVSGVAELARPKC
jgi:hypothetical protein